MNKLFILSFFLPFALLGQPKAGYYNAAIGKSDAALKTQLYSIISTGTTDVGYDGLYSIYQTSDNTTSGKVWDMYSMKADGTAAYYYSHNGATCGNYNAEADCYNREHTFCDSWLGKASPQRSDAYHIVPTDGYVNNRRSSYPHGKVASASWTSTNGSKLGTSDATTGYSGTVFEPIDEYKGDFARMYFYVSTRYESKIAGWVGNGSAGEILAGNTYPAYKSWFYGLMLKWNTQDPVSQKEITRNNAIEVYQHNRNPFIDHPELAEFIWGTHRGEPWLLTAGVEDLNVEFSISPNPAQSELTINTNEMNLGYTIYNLNGQILQAEQLNIDHSISINKLDKGMYLLQLKEGGRKAIKKFIVSK